MDGAKRDMTEEELTRRGSRSARPSNCGASSALMTAMGRSRPFARCRLIPRQRRNSRHPSTAVWGRSPDFGSNRPAKSLSSLHHLCLTSRNFVPWRFLDAGHLSVRSLLVAGVQKPAHEATYAAQQLQTYSMISSASTSRLSGIVNPSAFAVLRLITRSNLVGCSTGISFGLVPRRILSTKSAERRKRSG
jgi:hypothetical protein